MLRSWWFLLAGGHNARADTLCTNQAIRQLDACLSSSGFPNAPMTSFYISIHLCTYVQMLYTSTSYINITSAHMSVFEFSPVWNYENITEQSQTKHKEQSNQSIDIIHWYHQLSYQFISYIITFLTQHNEVPVSWWLGFWAAPDRTTTGGKPRGAISVTLEPARCVKETSKNQGMTNTKQQHPAATAHNQQQQFHGCEANLRSNVWPLASEFPPTQALVPAAFFLSHAGVTNR